MIAGLDYRHQSLREQPGGAFSPADLSLGSADAPLPFARAGTAIPQCPRSV